MKLQHITTYISTPTKVITTLITLLVAVMILQAVTIEIIVDIFVSRNRYQQDKPELTAAQEKRWRIHDMKKEFLVDGTVHLIHTTEERTYRRDKDSQIEVYDVNNNLLWTGEQGKNPYTYLQWPDYRAGSLRLEPGYMAEMRMITPQLSQTLMVPVINSKREILQRWCYEPGPDCFVGFNSEGKKIGYISANGFTESQYDAKPFGQFKSMTSWQEEDAPSPQLLWHTKNRLYQINFEKTIVEIIMELQNDTVESIGFTNWGDIEQEKSEYHPQMHLLTEKSKHILILKEPRRQLNINLPTEWLCQSPLVRSGACIVVFDDKIFVRNDGTDQKSTLRDYRFGGWRKQVMAKSHKMWIELYELQDGGDLKFVNRFEWIRPPLVERMGWTGRTDLFSKTINYATTVSTPLYNMAWLCCWHFSDDEYGFYRNWLQPYRDMAQIIQELQPSKMSWNWAVGGLLLCAAFWHGWSRRTTKAKLISWLVLVALFNLAGFLTYLALNHTTVIRCSACGKKRGLDQSDCPACKALLPIPELRETDLILVGQSNS